MARIVDNSNQITSARWAGDYFNREHMVPGGGKLDAAQWASTTYTITTSGVANVGATSIPVVALPVALPSGTILDFTGPGEFALLTASAAVGATSLTVEALDAAIESGDTASYTVTDPAPVTVPSGTVIGRTFAERDSSMNFGPVASGDEEVYIVCFDVYNASVNADVELYRPGSIVKENFLPNWANLSSAVKALVRSHYRTVAGQA